MAITDVSITQDNVVGGSNLLPVHSPLVFKVDATYSGSVPGALFVDLVEDGEVLETYRCIPYSDPLATVRTFVFSADIVIRGLMEAFDDTFQLNDTLVHLPNITKALTLKFYDPDEDTTSDSVTAVFVHGSAQFGEDPNFEDIYNNEDDVYYGPEGEIVYLYFYNEDAGNTLTVGDASLQEVIALNDDLTEFSNDDGTLFSIEVPIT